MKTESLESGAVLLTADLNYFLINEETGVFTDSIEVPADSDLSLWIEKKKVEFMDEEELKDYRVYLEEKRKAYENKCKELMKELKQSKEKKENN